MHGTTIKIKLRLIFLLARRSVCWPRPLRFLPLILRLAAEGHFSVLSKLPTSIRTSSSHLSVGLPVCLVSSRFLPSRIRCEILLSKILTKYTVYCSICLLKSVSTPSPILEKMQAVKVSRWTGSIAPPTLSLGIRWR